MDKFKIPNFMAVYAGWLFILGLVLIVLGVEPEPNNIGAKHELNSLSDNSTSTDI